MPKTLAAGFRKKDPISLLAALAPGVSIPENLRSKHADRKRASVTGFGPLQALTQLLDGDVQIHKSSGVHHATSVEFTSSGKNRDHRRMVHSVINHPRNQAHVHSWKGLNGQTGPYVAALVQALLTPHILPEINQRYFQMLEYVRDSLKLDFPNSSPIDWHVINNDQTARDLIMSLSDSMYYETKHRLIEETLDFTGQYFPERKDLTKVRWVFVSPDEYGLTEHASTPENKDPGRLAAFTPFARLERLTRTGGTALMVGPTGTLKTETAKRIAVHTNSKMITLKGAAGIEDRDFFGSITPTENGPKWVDGPLTQAFRMANEHPTVLIIDELLRFEPLYANVLIGALDTVNPTEMTAMDLTASSDEPHYVITLPTGEVITTPKSRLTIIATTNVGDDYAQFTQLDSALQGRFELQIDMPQADPNVLTSIYTEHLPEDANDCVTELINFEEFTRTNTGTHGGLLQRATNPRVTLNLLKEALRIHADPDFTLAEALEYALEATIIPYCAPRDTSGTLAEDAAAVIRDEFSKVTRAAS